jgi:hypothetical protein
MEVPDATITALDNAAETGLLASSQSSNFRRMAMVANAICQLRALLTPEVMAPVMALQNTSLGFKTDRKGDGYPMEIVRDCLIEATLQGVFPVGNEFNIIANNMYITKEGFGHKLKDVKGLTYSITPGIPSGKAEGAIINMEIEWRHNGHDGRKVIAIPVRVNSGMGADAIIGKATRKARAWLYAHVTGQEVPDGDAEDLKTGSIDVPVTSRFEKPAEPLLPDPPKQEPKTEQKPATKTANIPTGTEHAELMEKAGMALSEAGLTMADADKWAKENGASAFKELPLVVLRNCVKNPAGWVAMVRKAGEVEL